MREIRTCSLSGGRRSAKGDLVHLLRPDTYEPYVFRDRVLALCWRTLRRRGQKTRDLLDAHFSLG